MTIKESAIFRCPCILGRSKRRTAAAGSNGIRVVDRESAAHHGLLIVDLCAVKDGSIFLAYKDLQAMELELGIVFFNFMRKAHAV